EGERFVEGVLGARRDVPAGQGQVDVVGEGEALSRADADQLVAAGRLCGPVFVCAHGLYGPGSLHERHPGA
ncbi:MAG: hypothetical protein ACE5GO_00420, partial [Anaerolineales bacterium]